MNMPIAFSRTSGRALCWPEILAMLTLGAICLPVSHAAAQDTAPFPEAPGQLMLILNTLTAVNHGNITGNYTVLRDLASEPFRQRNTAGDLATTFANLRKKARDLSPILVTRPQLTQRPALDQYGRLQLVGYFPTRPQAVRFGLAFEKVNDAWVIDEIVLGVAPIESVVPKQHATPTPSVHQSVRMGARPAAGSRQMYEAPPRRN